MNDFKSVTFGILYFCSFKQKSVYKFSQDHIMRILKDRETLATTNLIACDTLTQQQQHT